MSLTNPNKIVTEERLNEYHQTILPYLGGMPDILANKFAKGDMYSTDEKMIGQWIDGKPLYQKVISGNLPSSAGSTGYPHSISDADEFICVKGIVFWGGHESTEMPVINANSKIPVIFIPSINDSTILINVDSDRSSTTFAVIIQYTKSTDSAISIGNDTDYSTTEKIVGTWIDGKPLYQKTFTTSTLNSTTAVGGLYSGQFVFADYIPNADLIFVDTEKSYLSVSGTTRGIISAYKMNTYILFFTEVARDNFTVTMTIQYTKTTD